MSWTDERVETLKTLWKEGLSASQIANKLGGVSRNAVIGKVHRLGLEGRAKPNAPKKEAEPPAAAVSAEPAPQPEAKTRAEPAPEPANDPGIAPMADDDSPTETATAEANETTEDDVVVPIPLKLKLTELTERTCKWPIGDPMHDDFHFCGHEADEGRPYCEYHSGLAFQPASERRRVR